MINVSAQIREYLLTKPALVALTSTRLWGDRDVPPPGYAPSDGGAIAFKPRGGLPDYSESQLNVSMQFKCYGADELEAGNVYRALHDALRRAAGKQFKSCTVEVLGQPLREPQTLWPYVLGFWRFWMNADQGE